MEQKAIFKSWQSYREFSRLVINRSRFIYGSETKKFLDSLLISAASHTVVLPKHTLLFRAQIGHDTEPVFSGDE